MYSFFSCFLSPHFFPQSTEITVSGYRIRRHAKSHPREDKEKEEDNRSGRGEKRERKPFRDASHKIPPPFLITVRFNGAFEGNGTRGNCRAGKCLDTIRRFSSTPTLMSPRFDFYTGECHFSVIGPRLLMNAAPEYHVTG